MLEKHKINEITGLDGALFKYGMRASWEFPKQRSRHVMSPWMLP